MVRDQRSVLFQGRRKKKVRSWHCSAQNLPAVFHVRVKTNVLQIACEAQHCLHAYLSGLPAPSSCHTSFLPVYPGPQTCCCPLPACKALTPHSLRLTPLPHLGFCSNVTSWSPPRPPHIKAHSWHFSVSSLLHLPLWHIWRVTWFTSVLVYCLSPIPMPECKLCEAGIFVCLFTAVSSVPRTESGTWQVLNKHLLSEWMNEKLPRVQELIVWSWENSNY